MILIHTRSSDQGSSRFQAQFDFLKRWGITPMIHQDLDGYYFAFAVPKQWGKRDKIKFAQDFNQHGWLEPSCCHCDDREAIDLGQCGDCGTRRHVCEECLFRRPAHYCVICRTRWALNPAYQTGGPSSYSSE